MAFRLLATPESLLKPGMFVGMIGDWGDKFVAPMPESITVHFPGLAQSIAMFYRITWAEQKIRDYYAGIMPASPSPDGPYGIDPDASIGLEPHYYTSLYQTRIGMSPDWQCYIKWPTQSYRMGLEEPGFYPDPTDTDKRYIGFIDSVQSPISDEEHPDVEMRFEWWFVKDWMPVFYAYVNSMSSYVKLIMRFIVNHLAIQKIDPSKEPNLILAMLRGEVPWYRVFHYSEYERKGAGLAESLTAPAQSAAPGRGR